MEEATQLYLVLRLMVCEAFPLLFPMQLHNVLADTEDTFIQVNCFNLQLVAFQSCQSQ
jgi:hypothetical protein